MKVALHFVSKSIFDGFFNYCYLLSILLHACTWSTRVFLYYHKTLTYCQIENRLGNNISLSPFDATLYFNSFSAVRLVAINYRSIFLGTCTFSTTVPAKIIDSMVWSNHTQASMRQQFGHVVAKIINNSFARSAFD